MRSLDVDNCPDDFGSGLLEFSQLVSVPPHTNYPALQDNGTLSIYLPVCFPSPVFKQILFSQSTAGPPLLNRIPRYSHAVRLFNSSLHSHGSQLSSLAILSDAFTRLRLVSKVPTSCGFRYPQ